MISGMFDSGAMPVLERTVQYAAERHKHIVNNIANLSTPNYRPTDLPGEEFSDALSRAIDARRAENGGPTGELEMDNTRHIRFNEGGIEAREIFADDNILFHDRNNRSLEHLMQDLAENAMKHNGAINFLRNEFELMETAIRERI